MNQSSYFELILDKLEDCLSTCKTDIYIQDRKLCHTAKLVVNWFEFCKVKLLKPWPENSPDLVHIEKGVHGLKDYDTFSFLHLHAILQGI